MALDHPPIRGSIQIKKVPIRLTLGALLVETLSILRMKAHRLVRNKSMQKVDRNQYTPRILPLSRLSYPLSSLIPPKIA